MKLLFSVFLFTQICIGLNAQNSELEKLIFSTRNSNTRLDKSIALNQAASMGTGSFKQFLSSKFKDDTNYVENINHVFKIYNERREINDIASSIVRFNSTLIKGSLLCFSNQVKIPLLCDIASKGLDKVELLVQETNNENTLRILKTGLENVTRSLGRETADRIKEIENSDEFIAELDKHTDILEALYKNISNVTEEDRSIVLAAMLKVVDDEIKTGFAGIDSAIELQADEIEKVNKNVTALSLAFFKYADENNSRLDTIIQIQEEINNQLFDINNTIGNVESGVSFLQSFVFSRMSPAEQIIALELQNIPGISDPEREDLIEKITLFKKQQELNKHIKTYLEGASEIVNIARNLGLDNQLVDKLNTGTIVGSSIFKAYTSLQTGNFLGAVSAISKVFGIGGMDLAGERHKQIIDGLNNIYKKIDMVEMKIDLLEKRQIQIITNQKVIYEGIVSLSKQIDSNQNELLVKLEDIHDDIKYNRSILTNYIKSAYTDCAYMIVDDPNLPRPDTIINTQINKYPSFFDLIELHANWSTRGAIVSCFDIVGNVRKYDGSFDHPIFNLRSSDISIDSSKVRPFIERVHLPLINVLTNDTTFSRLSLNQKKSSFFIPSKTVDSLNEKLRLINRKTFDLSSSDLNPIGHAPSFTTNFSTPLWFESVERHINFISNIHYYKMVLDRANNMPFSIDRLLNRNVITVGYQDLRNGLVLLDFALAQQNLYSGDILLPILGEIIVDTDTTKRTQLQQAIDLVNSNSLLAHNIILYQFRKEVLNNSSFIYYKSSFNSQDLFSFKLNFKSDWDLVWSNGDSIVDGIILEFGWHVKIGNQYYTVPDPDKLIAGELNHSNRISVLTRLKERLLEEIETYEIYFGFNNSSQRYSYNLLNAYYIPMN